MAKYRCMECDGEYSDMSGGARYYHACPESRLRAGVLPSDPPVVTPILNPRDENLEPVPGVELGRPRRDGARRIPI